MGGTLDWIAFQRVFGYGTTRSQLVLDAFAHPSQLLALSGEALAGTMLNAKEKSLLRNPGRLLQEAEKTLEAAYKLGCKVLTPDSQDYPQRLRNIYAPPAVLYLRGSLDGLDDQPAIAMVGTRKISAYGKRAAQELSGALVTVGIAVVSGLAAGVDAASHWATLRAGGRTIAVLGNGPDTIYPYENRELYAAILKQGGAIITEFPPGERPLPFHFPIRNRIISGLSLGVVVVEGERRSGSLITAGHAVTQDREVFAVPGEIYAPMSQATNWLISQGATMVTCLEDILRQFPYIEFASPQETAEQISLELPDAAVQEPLPDFLNGNQRQVLQVLGHQPRSADSIATAAALSTQQVLSALTQLELFGLIQACPGQCYKRK